MERITRGMLQRKVDYLKSLGIEVHLDHHQPGGATYTWAIEDKTGSRRLGWSGRMTAREMLIHLCGMCYTAELIANRIVNGLELVP